MPKPAKSFQWVFELRLVLLLAAATAVLFLAGCSTALIDASVQGDIDAARALLESGADPNREAVGEYPLRKAVLNNDIAMARLLVEHGADLDARRLLPQAARYGYRDMVDLFLEFGADLDNSPQPSELNALAAVVMDGNSEMARYLLEKGADPDAAFGDMDYYANSTIAGWVRSGTAGIELLQALTGRIWKRAPLPGNAAALGVPAGSANGGHGRMMYMQKMEGLDRDKLEGVYYCRFYDPLAAVKECFYLSYAEVLKFDYLGTQSTYTPSSREFFNPEDYPHFDPLRRAATREEHSRNWDPFGWQFTKRYDLRERNHSIDGLIYCSREFRETPKTCFDIDWNQGVRERWGDPPEAEEFFSLKYEPLRASLKPYSKPSEWRPRSYLDDEEQGASQEW